MGYMINNVTCEVWPCASQEAMLAAGWQVDSGWEFVENADEFINSEYYKNYTTRRDNLVKKDELLLKIDETERAQFRSFKAIATGTATDKDKEHYNKYESEIAAIRADIAALDKVL